MGHPEIRVNAFLRCPDCQGGIAENGGNIECAQCGSKWPVVDGVPSFVSVAPYWGEPGMTPEVMRQILRGMETKTWHEIMKDHPASQVRQRYQFISDLTRGDWHKLLALRPDSVALDLGAGLGTISQAISRAVGHVFAVEQVQERVQFMRRRFQQEGCENITVIRASADSLPFAPDSLDLIVLNGVLEWLPLSRKHDNPRRAQLHYLKRLRELLKPLGTLYVGIENRTEYSLLVGGLDPHISLRHVAVLPRPIADLICEVKIHDRYRTYLYSHWGYKRLFSEAGYRAVEIFAALPSYSQPRKILSLREKSDRFIEDVWFTKNRLSQWVKKLMVRLDLLKYFGYAYIIFARK